MRAGLRVGAALLVTGLIAGPPPALAQQVPPVTTNTPATDSIGPKDLKDFSLGGTVTRPAEPPPASATGTRPRVRVETPIVAPTNDARANTPEPVQRAPARAPVAVAATNERPPPARLADSSLRPAPSVVATVPSVASDSSRPASLLPTRPAGSLANFPAAGRGTLAPAHSLSLLPWLLAALVLGAGAAFLMWRNRSREAFAGVPRFEAFLAPETARAPVPRPVPASPPPRQRPEPSIPGIVSTRLRPWVEIGFHPLRFIVDEEKVAIDFEVELFNSGSAPAKGVLVEAALFNAGPSQQEQMGAFFANPVAKGDRIATIPPLKRLTIRNQVVAPRENIQLFEVAGRKVCVPLIAFNTLYGWSSGEGQTSLSYLFGRDTQGEKLAPFRLDLGPRLFRGLGARLVPGGFRN